MTQIQCLKLYFHLATANDDVVTVDAVPSTDVELSYSKSPVENNKTNKIRWAIGGVMVT